MIELNLANGKICLLDDCDAHLLSMGTTKWHFHKGRRGNGYAAKMINNFDGNGGRKMVYMHHAILGNPINGLEIDHVDGDGLNNRRSNLRLVTVRENQHNRFEHRKGKPFGIRFNEEIKQWVVCIKATNNKLKYVGAFRDVDSAKAALSTFLSSHSISHPR